MLERSLWTPWCSVFMWFGGPCSCGLGVRSFVCLQGPPGGAGVPSQPAAHGVWKGELVFLRLLFSFTLRVWVIRNADARFPEQILPGVRIIIANPETKGPMGESHLGEVRPQASFLQTTSAFILKTLELRFSSGRCWRRCVKWYVQRPFQNTKGVSSSLKGKNFWNTRLWTPRRRSSSHMRSRTQRWFFVAHNEWRQ